MSEVGAGWLGCMSRLNSASAIQRGRLRPDGLRDCRWRAEPTEKSKCHLYEVPLLLTYYPCICL